MKKKVFLSILSVVIATTINFGMIQPHVYASVNDSICNANESATDLQEQSVSDGNSESDSQNIPDNIDTQEEESSENLNDTNDSSQGTCDEQENMDNSDVPNNEDDTESTNALTNSEDSIDKKQTVNEKDLAQNTTKATDMAYDVSEPHVVINQIYGAGTDGYVSHSFIELYNQSEAEISMCGWSINYRPSAAGGDEGWKRLELTGSIKPHSSYLIKCAEITKESNKKYSIVNSDQEWNQVLYNKGLCVLLLSNNNDIDGEDIFDCSSARPMIDGYVDMLAVSGNDGKPEQAPLCYEGAYSAIQSKKKAIRRINFADTDNNTNDAEDIDFSKDNMTQYLPKSAADGAWGMETIDRDAIIAELDDINKLIPKYYKNYCTSETIAQIDAVWALGNNIEGMTDEELREYSDALKDITDNIKYVSYGELYQFFITTDKGNGESYGDTLTKPMGYVGATITLTDANGNQEICDTVANIKVRGNSTAGLPKKPYNIKFSKKQDLFGFGKSKKWVLLADYLDPTVMRNNLALDLGEQIGAASTMNHKRVEVWLDGQYNGIYLLTEKIEADKNRVNINPDNGDYLYEMDVDYNAGDGEIYFYTQDGQLYRLREPDEDVCTAEQLATAKEKMDRFEWVIKNGNFDEIEKIIDVDSFIDVYIVNEYMKNLDYHWKSAYFYYDSSVDKFYAGPLWDFDWTNSFTSIVDDPNGACVADDHYYKYLFQFLPFRLAVQKRWGEVKYNFSSTYANGGWLDIQQNTYGGAVQRNTDKWHQGRNNTALLSDFRTWLKNRYTWMDNYLTSVTTGVYKDGEALYYFSDGNAVPNAGLIQYENNYYYVVEDGKVSIGQTEVTKTNNVMRPDGKGQFPIGMYTFDDSGKMNVPVEYEVVTETIRVEPTCTEAGQKGYWTIERTGKRYDSADCKNEITADDLTIPALGHNYISTVVAPTSSERGYTIHKCSRCGDSYVDSYTNPVVKAQNTETIDKKLKTTKIKSLTAKKKSITVKWKKQSKKTKGYQIQYSTDKKFRKNVKTVTIRSAKITSKTIKKLKAGKKYYVRIRTCKGGKENIFSKWCKTKSVVTLK